MCAAKIFIPLKFNQLDPDLQAQVKDLSLTTLGDFRAVAKQIRAIQETRWTLRQPEEAGCSGRPYGMAERQQL